MEATHQSLSFRPFFFLRVATEFVLDGQQQNMPICPLVRNLFIGWQPLRERESSNGRVHSSRTLA